MRREATNPLLLQASANVSQERDILPKNVRPLHYNLLFEPDLETGIYQGSVSIRLEAIEETTSITLNIKETKVTHSSIYISLRRIESKDLLTTYDEKAQTFTVLLLNETIPRSQIFLLHMKFEGSLDTSHFGFFRSSFIDPNSGKPKWVASTQMQPVDARKAFPCFDEPALKATFRVTLIAEKHFTCLGNMDIDKERDMLSTMSKRPKKATTFNLTPLMSTYLVSFAVGEFNMLETNNWRVPIRIWAPKDQPIEKARFALEVSARTMKHHEETFDIKYPLPKLDQIQTPGNAGGMENWGLVTYAPGYLIYDEETGSAAAKQRTVEIITHELAHQWFGNIVTMEFWDGLWLNESFASWAHAYVQDQMFPEWDTNSEFITSQYQMALDMDSSRASHPIQVPVHNADEINQVFDDISYAKGQSILTMLVNYIGIENFLAGVRKYLSKHSFGNTVTTDLWEALSESCGFDVESFMSTWTTKVGYPVLTVTELEPSSSSMQATIHIEQHRYLKSGPAKPDEDTTTWSIPLNILTTKGIKSKTLSSGFETVSIGDSFYKLNANQSGFYRVAYPPSRLVKLGYAAREGLLSVEDRIGLISDTTALAASGCYNTSTTSLLHLLQSSFANDPSYFVWIQILSSLTTLQQTFKYHTKTYTYLLSFQNSLLTTILRTLGQDFSTPKTDNGKRFQALIFNAAGQAYHRDVVNKAKEIFEKWIYNSEPLPPDACDSILALTIQHSDTSQEFQHLLHLYQTSLSHPSPENLPASTLLSALGHTQIRWHKQQLLDLWLKCETQENTNWLYAIRSLVIYAEGAEMVWEFVKKEYDVLLKKASSGVGQRWRFIRDVLGGLSTSSHLADVKKFFYEEGRDLSGFDMMLKQCVESIELRATWSEREGEEVQNWLEEKGFGNTGMSVFDFEGFLGET